MKQKSARRVYVARFLHLRDDGCGPLSWVYHSSDMVLAAAVDILGGHSNFRLIREREREREEKGVLRLFHISLVTADDTPTPLLEHAKDGAAAAAKSCCWADLTFWEKEFHEEKQKSFQ